MVTRISNQKSQSESLKDIFAYELDPLKTFETH